MRPIIPAQTMSFHEWKTLKVEATPGFVAVVAPSCSPHPPSVLFVPRTVVSDGSSEVFAAAVAWQRG